MVLVHATVGKAHRNSQHDGAIYTTLPVENKRGMIWIMCMWCMENHIIGAHLFMGWEPFNVRERVSFDHMSSGAGTLQ